MTIPVSQEDREAAAPLFRTDWARDEMLAGKRDDDSRVQAFAHHRLRAIEEAAKRADAEADKWTAEAESRREREQWELRAAAASNARAFRKFAAAIRKLSQ